MEANHRSLGFRVELKKQNTQLSKSKFVLQSFLKDLLQFFIFLKHAHLKIRVMKSLPFHTFDIKVIFLLLTYVLRTWVWAFEKSAEGKHVFFFH